MPATSRVVPPFFATTLPADFGVLTLLPALVSVATASAPAIKTSSGPSLHPATPAPASSAPGRSGLRVEVFRRLRSFALSLANACARNGRCFPDCSLRLTHSTHARCVTSIGTTCNQKFAAVLDVSNPRRRSTVARPCRAGLGMLILRRGSALRTAGTSYQVQVRMQDGSYRNFNYSTQPPVQVGGRVRVSGDSLTTSSSPREPARPSRVTTGYRFDVAASPASARHP
jgi:hypothetical protein